MDEISETGYMFAYTYGLDTQEIEKIVEEEIHKLDPRYHNYNLKINVVKNKDDLKLGYSYLWIDNEELYFALTGFNFDGSKRVEKIVTELESKEEEVDAWGDISDDFVVTYKDLEPLIKFSDLKITDVERENFRLMSNDIEFNLFQAKKYISPEYKNSLYARYIPAWLTAEMILEYFKPFEKDSMMHHRKGNNFTYPIVKIKNKNVNIVFSNLYPNTASFLVNMVKKVYFQEPRDHSKNALIFFKQNKKREYD